LLRNQVFHENILQKICHQIQEVFLISSKLLQNIINKDMDTNKTKIITASKKTATKLNNVQFKIYYPTISCISPNKVQQVSVGTPSPEQLQ
jgi:hypothetical protein